MKPICVDCRLFFKPEKNSTYFEEGMPIDVNSTTWKTYKLWCGDLWKCDGCGKQIVVGVGFEPVSEHYQPNHAELCHKFKSQFRVDDC